MSSPNDPFASFRGRLQAALRAAPERAGYSYAALMRDEIAAVENDEDVQVPGLLCLATADALGGKTPEALAAATAVSLLAAMSRIFEDIASEGPAGLEPRWGMPRTLNGGDAFYALAQTLLLGSALSIGGKRGLAVMGSLDEACHELSLELMSVARPRRSLLSAAAALGGMLAAADDAQVAALKAFGRSPNLGAPQSLPENVRTRLLQTVPYLTNRS